MDTDSPPAPARRRLRRRLLTALGVIVVLAVGFLAGTRLTGSGAAAADQPAVDDGAELSELELAPVLDDASAMGSNSITVDPTQAASLNELVDSLAPGGELILGPGRFEIPAVLLLDDPITIRGAGADVTELIGTANGPAVIDIRALSEVSLEDVTVRYEGSSVSDVVRVRAGRASIARCAVTGGASGGSGLVVSGGARLTVTDCALDENSGNGLRVQDDARVEVEGSTASTNGRSGFAFSARAEVSVIASEASGNGASGFATEANAELTVESSRSVDNRDFGFAWLGTATGTAVANTADTNGRSGFAIVDRAAPDLQDNTSTSNQGAGFAWLDTAAGTATGNTAEGNTSSGYLVLDNASPLLGPNAAQGNGGSDVAWRSGAERQPFPSG